MSNKSKMVDLYIQKSAEFAKPILIHFRKLVHEVCPDVEEKMRWSFPHFDYNGSRMCSMASFKKHCAISFCKASLMNEFTELIEMAKSEEAMGHLGKIKNLQDLPKDTQLKLYLKNAMQLNDDKIKLPSKQKSILVGNYKIPNYFIELLSQDKIAYQKFESLPESHKIAYIKWITEAKTDSTKNKRMNRAIELISEKTVKQK